LTVGDDECSKSAESLERLLAVLLSSVLVEWCRDTLRVDLTKVLGLPDEVLEEITLVLGEDQKLGLLNDISEIGDQLLTVLRQLGVGLLEAVPLECAVHGDIDLLVL
jgi:hypothetical protein